MKVGIVTFHRAHNCGAALQCVALITVLQRMGHDVRVLDCNNVGEGILFPNVRNPRVWLGWLYRLVVSGALSQRLCFRYWKFMKRFFPMTGRIGNEKPFPGEFDFFVVGSDQVFNPMLTGEFLDVFLLNGCCDDEKKISFAASFGVSTLPESYRSVFSECLSRFQALGIRENSGCEICEKELNVPISPVVTIDPTLLLSSTDYLRFETPVKTGGDYVLVYWIGWSREYVCELANRIAKRSGLRVIVATITTYKSDASWIPTSPDEFLYLLRNARYVVTTSFHGTAFAIINRVPFLTVIPNGMNVAGRIVGLLEQLSLTSQIVHEGDALTDGRLDGLLDVDFKNVGSALWEIQIGSIDFLRNAMANAANV